MIMYNKFFPKRQHQKTKSSVMRTCLTLVVSAFWLCASIQVKAESVLEKVTFVPGAGSQVDIVMSLSQATADPKLFTTDSPPRIAIDFEDTRNGLTDRKQSVNVGSVNSVSTIEAGGRTRVVVELARSTGYSTRMDGNSLILSVGGNSDLGAGSASVGNDPSKSIADRPQVANIDFSRGKEGEGKVIVLFDKEGTSTDLRKEGSKLIIELRNVGLPESLSQRLDVTDFATVVEAVETHSVPNGARIEIKTTAAFEQLAYQTGNQYVVEISPVKQVSEAEKRLKEPEYSGKRVTFNFQDIPVRSVLQLVAQISELNVVVADTVQGNVTLRLDNVPWDQALDIILQAKGLDKRRRGNVIWIAPTAEIAQREQALEDARIALEDRAPLVTEYITINYGNAKDVSELLTASSTTAQGGGQQGGATSKQSTGFLSSRGSVSFDSRTNTLLLNDTIQKIQEIKELIALLDRPVDQVLIESRIVIADETFGRELGAKFGISGAHEDNNGNIVTTGGTSAAADSMANVALNNRLAGRSTGLPVGVSGPPGSGVIVPSQGQRLNVNLPVASPAGSFALAVLGQDYLLDLELSALHQEGKGEVISNPRVITANQREALIKQGDEVAYITTQQQAAGGLPQQTVQFKEVLLELKVTPTITQDNRVFLVMNVKKDEVSGVITSAVGTVPQIAKREINTAVLVDNGQTVVLGGVYEFKNRKDLTKVPFLGDIPAVGNLFKSTKKSSSKAELLIFVTPKILRQTR
jgi:type IV pilus assembly protein PilQ